MLDVPLSLTIAKEIEAEKKECWYHALRAFFLYEELQSGWYVEGWAIPDKGIPLNIEHGWIERTNGSIIDPTWAMLGNKDVKYFVFLFILIEYNILINFAKNSKHKILKF